MRSGIVMTQANFETMRHAMVASQLRTSAVTDVGVVAAMGQVARERFVPDARAAPRLDSGLPSIMMNARTTLPPTESA